MMQDKNYVTQDQVKRIYEIINEVR
jgi:hypothetical protein